MELPVNPLALLPLFALFLYSAWKRFTRKRTILDTLPWVGLPRGPFAKIRARCSIKGVRQVFAESWEQYSSQGKTFLFPMFLGRPLIVLPSSQTQWIAEQPESNLSVHGQLKDNMALDHGMLDEAILRAPIHEMVIRNELTRTLGTTLEPVREELLQSLDAFWGTSTEWHDVVVWESLTRVVSRTSNRIFVGSTLCRNEEFVNSTVGFAVAVVVAGNLLRPMPESLRDIFSWAFLFANKKHFNTAAKHLVPLIEQRKADLTRAERDKTFKYEEPFDLLQWNIRNSLKNPDPREWSSTLIAKRYMAVSFAAIHTTSTMSTHILLNIAASPPKLDVVNSLREEASRVYNESGREWSKASLAKLVRMDSVIRESLRLGSLGAFGLVRKVVAKGGLVSQNGVELPEGSHIAVHMYGSQMMDGHYENAAIWDPFRFSRARESLSDEAASQSESEKDTDEILKDRHMAAISTGPSFLTFGHGRHACPGRFFAVQEIKLLLAQIILNYDIKYVEQRPESIWLKEAQIAPSKAKLTIRKLEVPLVEEKFGFAP